MANNINELIANIGDRRMYEAFRADLANHPRFQGMPSEEIACIASQAAANPRDPQYNSLFRWHLPRSASVPTPQREQTSQSRGSSYSPRLLIMGTGI